MIYFSLASAQTSDAVNIGFTMICGVLVVLMQLGFAMVESGLNSHRHTANILFKNLSDLSIGAIVFYLIGYKIMFPENSAGFLSAVPPSEGTTWFYQMAFAATAATIVSGAVAGRMQFKAYLIFSALLVGIIYPIVGFFCWSSESPFSGRLHDFAGSIVVHGVGGAAALAAITVLRPRMNRFGEGADPDRHHNLAYVLMGTLLLWVGWYGFNGGSICDLVTSDGSGASTLSRVLFNTTLGAAGGTIGGILVTAFRSDGKIDLKAAMNGCLGGLVSITAGCDIMPPWACLLAGVTGGAIVFYTEIIFENLENLELDDTVSAVAVHGICGIFGGILAGITQKLIDPQFSLIIHSALILGALTSVYFIMYLVFLGLKGAKILEVTKEAEAVGLDQSEHNLSAYNLPTGEDSVVIPTENSDNGSSSKPTWY